VITTEEREAITRTVLSAPLETPSKALAEQLGLSRQMVASIRIGRRYADVLPNLPRVEPAAMQRTCLDCTLFHHQPGRLRDEGADVRIYGQCSIGIPEAAESLRYARGCGAFQP